jgi:enterochelin esterase-like enzyme
MKSVSPSSQSQLKWRWLWLVVPFFISLLLSLLGAMLLFNAAIIGGLASTIIDIGLDPLRAQLIAALIMTTGAALIGTILGRRKFGAVIGAGIIFWFNYLIGFIELELQPLHDPGGNLEPLNSGALVHTSFVMMALALLAAFIGAAVGVALGEVLLDPLIHLAQLIWQRFRDVSQATTSSLKATTSEKKTTVHLIGSWIGAITMAILLVVASGSGDFFIFSPDIGLHSPPHLASKFGTVVQDSIVSRALGGQSRPFQVYLPPSYNTIQGQAKRYPTLYLLHGSPGRDIDWFTAGKADQSANTLIATHKIPELILILPDGNGRPGQTGEWGNSFDQKQLIETYVAVDLVKYVDRKYRTINSPAYRGIGGLSEGGFGAMNIAVHHPDIFGTVISLGGYYHAEGSIWGNNPTYIQENSPANYLPLHAQSWKLHIYLGAATKDQPYYNDTRQFAQELVKLHIRYQFDLQNGYHSWPIWQMQMFNALSWLRWG